MEKDFVLALIKGGSSLMPVTGSEISRKIKKSGPDVRDIIADLRFEGNLICANATGYWLAENRKQAEKWLESNDGRLRAMFRARSGFKRGLKRYVWGLTQEEIFV